MPVVAVDAVEVLVRTLRFLIAVSSSYLDHVMKRVGIAASWSARRPLEEGEGL
jgi:hypothetical protein